MVSLFSEIWKGDLDFSLPNKYLFSRQKLYVFVSTVLFQLAEIPNWSSFLNASVSGGLKIFD